MLPSRTAKTEFLHKIATATVDHYQVRNAILGNPKTIKIHVKRIGIPEVCRAKVVNLWLIKASKEGCSIIRRVWDGGKTTAHLKLRRDSGKRIYKEKRKEK